VREDGEEQMMKVHFLAALGAAAVTLAGAPFAKAESGIASIYAYEGGKTASGERASAKNLTAAHRSLPFGTHVRVINKRNGKSVVVRINDRGPFIKGRVIDVTPAAAQALGFSGLATVALERVDG
jgi:rare lipoprotein A